jgi:peptidoglycan/LPS O-acetylase OafA/YrhL
MFVLPIAAIVVLPAVLEPLHLASSLTLLFGVLLVYIASLNHDLFQGFGWVSRFLNLMGEKSYTIYLWHLLAFTLVQLGWRTVAGEAASDPTILHGGMITVAAVLSLFWADPMYRWVELPTRALGHRVARRIG